MPGSRPAEHALEVSVGRSESSEHPARDPIRVEFESVIRRAVGLIWIRGMTEEVVPHLVPKHAMDHIQFAHLAAARCPQFTVEPCEVDSDYPAVGPGIALALSHVLERRALDTEALGDPLKRPYREAQELLLSGREWRRRARFRTTGRLRDRSKPEDGEAEENQSPGGFRIRFSHCY